MVESVGISVFLSAQQAKKMGKSGNAAAVSQPLPSPTLVDAPHRGFAFVANVRSGGSSTGKRVQSIEKTGTFVPPMRGPIIIYLPPL